MVKHIPVHWKKKKTNSNLLSLLWVCVADKNLLKVLLIKLNEFKNVLIKFETSSHPTKSISFEIFHKLNPGAIKKGKKLKWN